MSAYFDALWDLCCTLYNPITPIMKSSLFEIAAGSTPGRDHLFQGGLLIGKNNQDAYAWRTLHGGNTVAAVVCDGCGSHRNSEVGAKIGAALLLSAIERRLPAAPASQQLPAEFWETVRQDVLADIRLLARTMAGSTSVTETLAEYFLFTIVGTLVTPNACWVFSIGDGVVIVDGVLENLGPFPGNAPPYLAYGITGSNIAEHAEMLSFKVSMYPVLTHGVLIGSDGVGELLSLHDGTIPASTELFGDISQFWTDDRYFKNKDLVRRRLTRLNGLQIRTEGGASSFVPGLLQDDTTLVVIRPVSTHS
jgi:hypothetical protein